MAKTGKNCERLFAILLLSGTVAPAFAESSAQAPRQDKQPRQVLESSESSEVYGPPNLLKTFPTPFTISPEGASQNGGQAAGGLEPIGISASSDSRNRFDSPLRRSLSEKLVPSRLYLPGRMILGKSAEFIVKGKPGTHVAIAMADKNSGAKPVLGRPIRLGSDRRLVTLGTIPDTGVLGLFVDTPIQGDLIGQKLYFEAALWTKPDMSDIEIAATVPSESGSSTDNSVLVGADFTPKRGIRIVQDNAVPMSQREASSTASTLGSGKP